MIDEQIFTDVSKALFPTLYRIGMSIVHSDADVQDAVQQAMMKAWIHRGNIVETKLRPWLTRVMVNECRNIQRDRMRMMPFEQMEDHTAAFIPPDLELAEAINVLPEKLRTPLLLKYSEFYSEKEVAETLQISIPAVKSRLYRARKALEKSLKVEVTFE